MTTLRTDGIDRMTYQIDLQISEPYPDTIKS